VAQVRISFRDWESSCSDPYRIFRTDYGHTEVAAHFGNGLSFDCSFLSIRLPCTITDPREYSISTKDFVVDDEGKLKGLNTGQLHMLTLVKFGD